MVSLWRLIIASGSCALVPSHTRDPTASPILQEHLRRPTENAVAPGSAHFETARSVSVAAAPSTRATELCLGTSPDFTGLNLGAHI